MFVSSRLFAHETNDGARNGQLGREQWEKRLELELGLLKLGGGIRVGDDPAPGEEMRLAVPDERGAQPDAKLAVLGSVHPADRARVPAAIDPLELPDQLEGGSLRLAADRGRRVQDAGELDRAARFGKLRANRRREMLQVAYLDHKGLVLGVNPDGVRTEAALDAAHDDPVLV